MFSNLCPIKFTAFVVSGNGVFLSHCFFVFSVGIGVFLIGLSQMSLFFSLQSISQTLKVIDIIFF